MPRRIRFTKLSGAGNDFILVTSAVPASAIPKLCDRRNGVGADGLLVVKGSKVAYYNADGSKAFCGNGARCAAWWLAKGRKKVAFSVSGIKVHATVSPHAAKLRMPDVGPVKHVHVDGYAFAHLDTGVPHAVQRVKDLPDLDVDQIGRHVRQHAAFAPEGTNVDFITVSKDTVSVRTYERGVEGETLACGTGAVAAALSSDLPSPVTVHARGGDLIVTFSHRKDGGFTDVWLEGPVRQTFTGEVTL